MRELSIIIREDHEGGKVWPVWHKNSGLTKSREIAVEIAMLAGWPPTVDVAVCESMTDDTFFDTDFEETQAEQALVGNPDYGYVDADFSNMKPRPIVPNLGESWVFVLGDRLYLN